MSLFDLILKEYFAIVEYIKEKYPVIDKKIIVSSNLLYAFLDKNLYIKRKDKLQIYKQLNFIICNTDGLTSAVYDKDTKKTIRKFIINYETYETLKNAYTTKIN